MGKRKSKQTPIPGDENGEEEEEEGKGAGFFACYLLTSLCPRFKGHTYIGYTLNPRRRIRQHNGEIGSGAWRTKRRRPWEMVLCIYGFPSNTAALQFEWAWQHPVESLAVRTAAASFKSLSGLANKIKLAYTMLTLPAWQSLNLTVNLFSTKYQSYTSACPALPEQMRTRICSMEELPCYNVNDECDDGNECEGLLDSIGEDALSEQMYTRFCSMDSDDGNECEDSLLGSTGEDTLPEQMRTRVCSMDEELPFYNANDEFDQRPSFMINKSGTRKSFSFASYEIVEDMQSTKVVELTTTTDLVADKELIKSHDIISDHEVEIIDVFTPSPCKKRSRRSLGPEIIDLTNSPLYV